VGLVVVVLTVSHSPATRRWILTGTLAAQTVNSSSGLTTPRATRDLARRRVTDLEIGSKTQEQSKSGGGTMKWSGLITAPSPSTSLNVLTRIRPSSAPDVTPTRSSLGLSGVPVWAAVSVYGANRTSAPMGAVVVVPELFRRFVPMIATTVPQLADPPHGVTNVMVGEQPPGFALVKSVGLLAVALALVTWIVPLASPATVAQISVPETTLNSDTGVPPISTLVTIGSLKFVPVITTTHPAGPLVGENDEMVGEVADAGASRPSTISDATNAGAAARSPKCRLKRAIAPSSLLARDTRRPPTRRQGGSGGHCCCSRSIPMSTTPWTRSS
jgi:hypothetical protein